MPDNEAGQSSTVWPLPSFYFTVTIGALKGTFQEVSGLNADTPVIEYRHGTNPNYSTIKMPGIKKVGNVTLKRGIFKDGDSFWTWHDSITRDLSKRQTIVIELLDEAAATQMKWTLSNAQPIKITLLGMKGDEGEIAVELIELAFETLTANVA